MDRDILTETSIRIAHLNDFTSCRFSIAITIKCTLSLVMLVLHLAHGSVDDVSSDLFCDLVAQLGLRHTFLVVVAFTLTRCVDGSWFKGIDCSNWGNWSRGNDSFRCCNWCHSGLLLGHSSCLRHRSSLGDSLRYSTYWSITLWNDLASETVQG